VTSAAIDVGQLFELAWASAVSGIAVAVCFSLVIVGAVRAEDCRRNRRAGSATAYAALSIVAGVLFIGIAVFAISVITAK
jgi:threonine/homoserine/homoserine lactone efflux protein